ncbi:hypothetical protein GMOD_00002544 [Pyrenophora seminiperda CCB06]|uniref:Uncharacterized protein n=1 Tax=Pyrenophora seminiperda CCB06 TaxID=1302712 RepID=A0A3M7M2M8_9PLEO|nr:hypothetical protein GMOD_00002544 [Pyrenophora seminiperda CCB06]
MCNVKISQVGARFRVTRKRYLDRCECADCSWITIDLICTDDICHVSWLWFPPLTESSGGKEQSCQPRRSRFLLPPLTFSCLITFALKRDCFASLAVTLYRNLPRSHSVHCGILACDGRVSQKDQVQSRDATFTTSERKNLREESDASKHVVQVPCSDTVIPETQFDEHGHFEDYDFAVNSQRDGRESSLSPDDQEFVERFRTTRKAKAPCSPPTVKYLTKPTIETTGRPASSCSNSFSFAPAKKTQERNPSRTEETISQHAILASLTLPTLPKHGDQQSNNVTESSTSNAVPPSCTLNVKRHVSDSATTHDVGELQSLSKKTHAIQLQRQPGNPQNEQQKCSLALADSINDTRAESAPDPAPPALPCGRIVNSTKKVRSGKKLRKGKKGSQSQNSQQSSAPWPPRSRNATNLVNKTGMIDNTSLANSQNSSLLEPQDSRTNGPVEHDARVQRSVHHDQVTAYNHDWKDHNTPTHENTQYEAVFYDASQDMSLEMSQEVVVSSKKQVVPTPWIPASSTIVEQPHVVEVDQHSLPAVQHKLEETNQQAYADPSVDQSIGLPTQELHQNYISHVSQSVGPIAVMPPQPFQSQTEKDGGQPRDAEVVLHGISGRGGSDRVSKPRRKTRVVSGPQSQIAQGPTVSAALEQSIQSLKVAMLADSFRVQHEQTTTKKQYEETIMHLQSLVGVNEKNAILWEEKYEDSRKAYSRVVAGAKDNQKYLTGLQNDFEKLQKSVDDFKSRNKEAWKNKIAEIEDEKNLLRKECEMTIVKLTGSMRNMKKVVEDLYLELVISESKKTVLLETLSKQEASCKASEKKRDDLEKQLVSCTQTTHSQVADKFNTLVSMLKSLQSSVEKTAAKDRENLKIEGCLNALRGLEMTNFLKAEDVENMLRSVHERLASGLDGIAKSVESKKSFHTELRKLLEEQMQHLRGDVMKYEELAIENRKTHESNVSLKHQLEAQQWHSSQLEEQIQTYRQSEADLKNLARQLERDLDNLREVHKSQSEMFELEQGSVDLHERLRKSNEDLEAANVRIVKNEQLQHHLKQDGTKYKTCFENAKVHLRKLVGEQRLKIQNAAEMRKKLVKDCEDKINEHKRWSENSLIHINNDYHRKEIECEELSQKLVTSTVRVNEMNKRLIELQSSLDAMHQEQLAGQNQLKDAHQQGLSKSTETARLREQLQRMTAKLYNKTQDLVDLERQCTEAAKKATDLQNTYDQLQAQLSEQQSALELVRQEADFKLSKQREDAQNTLQTALDQVTGLQEENHELKSKLEQSRGIGDKLKTEKKAYIDKYYQLEQELAEIRAARDKELSQLRSDAAAENRKLIEQHHGEMNDLKRRLEQAEGALKKSESDARLSEDQYKAKIASDRTVAESKMLDLEKRYQEKIKAAEDRKDLGRQQGTQARDKERNSPGSEQDVRVSKNRKKISRQNQSVLEISKERKSQMEEYVPVIQTKSSQSQDDDLGAFTSLFEDQAGTEDDFDHEPHISLVGQPEYIPETQGVMGTSLLRRPESVTETQDVGILSMSQPLFKERLSCASQQELVPPDSSPADLSSIASEELTQMHKEIQPIYQSPMLRGREHTCSKHEPSQINVIAQSAQSDSDSVAEPRSSQSYDRPKSQANTASRMMPQSEHSSYRFQPRYDDSAVEKKMSSQYPVHKKVSGKLSSTNEGNPDIVYAKLPVARQTPSQHDPQDVIGIGSNLNTSRKTLQDHIAKRKSPARDLEREWGIKKPRVSPRTDRIFETPGSQPRTPQPSFVGPRSKVQDVPPYVRGTSSRPKASIKPSSVQPRTSRQMASPNDSHFSHQRPPSQAQVATYLQDSSARQTRSKSRKDIGFGDGFNDRFNEELRGRR